MSVNIYAARMAVVGLLVITAGCGGSQDIPQSMETATPGSSVPVITERFTTPLNVALDIDSPAVWHGPDGEHWLLATSKQSDCIVVYDAMTGEHITTFGSSGAGPGMFERPNGIAVADDILFVVERDNHRLQAIHLPDGTSMGMVGEDTLIRPYGITVVKRDGGWLVTVTDNYETPEETIPADADLDERVKQYQVIVNGDTVSGELVRMFGETSGPGVLKKVESIFADPDRDLLLIAEELDTVLDIKVYTLDGAFTGTVFGGDIFEYEPEGIALYETVDGGGYWFATDQDDVVNTFHLFDRNDFTHLGVFSGVRVRNTDGIALTQTAMDGFPAGMFYAVHSDSGVCAFALDEVLETLGLAVE